MPKLRYMSLENSTAPNAKAERQKSLLAKSDAAYCGYDIGIYTKMHWRIM